MKLLIVESPTKCKTIKKYLGPGYEVLASFGHIRDLANDKGFFGIDIENNFEPHFVTLKGKFKYIKALKAAVKRAEVIYLASDDDREGESIAWHLCQVLKLDQSTCPRVVFREITKTAVTEALANSRVIDMNMVYSQQARQILDKLIGYKLSPVLWAQISNRLSAGRVQSIVTKFVVDREQEIDDFNSQSFFKIMGKFTNSDPDGPSGLARRAPIVANFSKRIDSESGALTLLQKLNGASFTISDRSVKEETHKPSPPFITSTLQQVAGTRLGLSAKVTMSVAQGLYEKGKITYMRTDSVNIAKTFQTEVKAFVENKYGPEYVQVRQYTGKVKGGQEAHECIRPTTISDGPKDLGQNGLPPGLPQDPLSAIEQKLYDLIWQRAVASQMAAQKVEATRIKIVDTDTKSTDEYFTTTFEKELFPGYTVVYKDTEQDQEQDIQVPDRDTVPESHAVPTCPEILLPGTALDYLEIVATQKYTDGPPRYTEASLIKALETKGIGRPSTYASMVDKIQERKYVVKKTIRGKNVPIVIYKIDAGSTEIQKLESVWKTGDLKNKLVPTDIGIKVTRFLSENFSNLMDYDFTSQMEEKLDEIAQGQTVWHQIVKAYYEEFLSNL